MSEFFTGVGFLFSVFIGTVIGVIVAALLDSVGVSEIICNFAIVTVCAVVAYFVFNWWNTEEVTILGRY